MTAPDGASAPTSPREQLAEWAKDLPAYKLVPVEPTEAMRRAYYALFKQPEGEAAFPVVTGLDAYAAFIASAPSPSPLTDAELRRIWKRLAGSGADATAWEPNVFSAMREVERRMMEGK
jgi:hypothetical protein